MPTAEDFRAASTLMRAEASAVSASAGTFNDLRYDTGVLGGPYVGLVEGALVVSSLNCHRLADEMVSVAAQFDARAVVCDEYSSAMRAYRQRSSMWQSEMEFYWLYQNSESPRPWPGPAPSRPVKPAPWVEES